MKTVVVGMSGGVDSSVTALLLQEQGFRVIGLFMKNWEEEPCPATSDYEDVVAVCSQLKIPHYTVNFAKEYWNEVFVKCLDYFKAGFTPNPDILCNREIKFKLLLNKALMLGGDYLATGHYCQKQWHEGKWMLSRGLDSDKDQSYFLYTITHSILDKVLFPVGGMTKKEVRKRAEEAGLATAFKKDSTGICFIGKRNFKEFLSNYIPRQPGNFETPLGEIVGEHDGIAFYTIGQRKGLGLGGAGEAWYVLGKDQKRNVVIVDRGDHHPTLFQNTLSVSEFCWVAHPPLFPYKCTAKIRYRADDVVCTLFQGAPERLLVNFDEPQKAVTPHQSIVFYQGSFCIGGGIIAESA